VRGINKYLVRPRAVLLFSYMTACCFSRRPLRSTACAGDQVFQQTRPTLKSLQSA